MIESLPWYQSLPSHQVRKQEYSEPRRILELRKHRGESNAQLEFLWQQANVEPQLRDLGVCQVRQVAMTKHALNT